MRCYNCNKKFDYEKYYGICPKCGCFNRQETAAEQHEAMHDRFGDDSDESCHRSHRTFSAHPGEEREGSFAYQEDGYTYTAYEGEEAKKRGVGFFVFSLLFFIVSLFLFAGSMIYQMSSPMTAVFMTDTDGGSSLEIVENEPGDTFAFQESRTLQVLECREVADTSVLPSLEEGKKLVAVHVKGESDGTYESNNRLHGIYLETDGCYREPISSYYFEPYAQILGVYLSLDSDFLEGDGWYGFLVEADADTAVLWLDEYDCSDWDGGNLIRTHRIELPIENLTAEEAADLEAAAEEAEAEGLLSEDAWNEEEDTAAPDLDVTWEQEGGAEDGL